MTKKVPNFFIIGAPKCGTTALSEYLRRHPNVFVSTPKEPHYFNTDFSNRYTTSADDYLRLFEGATDDHIAIGEASIFYLRSSVAVKNILESYKDNTHFIVMLRNPIDAAYAWHSQVLYNFGEYERSFERAWNLQVKRELGQCLPRGCCEPKVFLYGPLFKYGEQLQRLFELVPRNRVKIVYFDAVVESTRTVYKEVLDFLELPDANVGSLERINENRQYSNWAIERLLRAASAAKHKIGIWKPLGVRARISGWNTRIAPREPISLSMRNRLADYYRGDVERLSRLVNRDLSGWTAGR